MTIFYEIWFWPLMPGHFLMLFHKNFTHTHTHTHARTHARTHAKTVPRKSTFSLGLLQIRLTPVTIILTVIIMIKGYLIFFAAISIHKLSNGGFFLGLKFVLSQILLTYCHTSKKIERKMEKAKKIDLSVISKLLPSPCHLTKCGWNSHPSWMLYESEKVCK